MPGYKRSDVGVIPDEWDAKPLGEIGDSLIGLTYRPSEVRAYGTLVLRSSNVQNRALCFDDNVFVDAEIPDRIMVRPGDILVCVRNGSRDLIGKSALIDERAIGMTFGAFMAVFRSEHGKLLQHVFQSGIFKKQINEHLGATINQITNKSLNSFKVPLPPTSEERMQIANALSDVDALLTTLDQMIAKKRDLKQAVMQQLLTGKTRLPGFSGPWDVKTIQQIAQVGRGRVISHVEIAKSLSPIYPVFSSQTSNDGIMGYLDSYDFEGDYVTWTTDGANAGTVFARSGRFNCTNVCGTIKLYNSDHRFIAAALGRVTQPHVSRHLGNPKLMNDVMKKIEVKIPSCRTEQTAIAEVLSEMDAELAVLGLRREKTHALKQAVMQELLTGKTRLV